MSRTAKNDDNDHTMKVEKWLWVQARTRWGVENPASKLREWMHGKWNEEKWAHQPPKLQPEPFVYRNRPIMPEDDPPINHGPWGSDRMLAAEWSDDVIDTFISTQKEWYTEQHWPYPTLEKHPDDIRDFLNDLMDVDAWDSLSKKQQGLLGCCRKAHENWMKYEAKRGKK